MFRRSACAVTMLTCTHKRQQTCEGKPTQISRDTNLRKKARAHRRRFIAQSVSSIESVVAHTRRAHLQRRHLYACQQLVKHVSSYYSLSAARAFVLEYQGFWALGAALFHRLYKLCCALNSRTDDLCLLVLTPRLNPNESQRPATLYMNGGSQMS